MAYLRCLQSVKAAADNAELERKPKRVRPADLDVYFEPHQQSSDLAQEPAPYALQKHVSTVRKQIWRIADGTANVFRNTKTRVLDVKDGVISTYEETKSNPLSMLRPGCITAAIIAGTIVPGRGKKRILRLASGTLGGTLAAGVAYPHKTLQIATGVYSKTKDMTTSLVEIMKKRAEDSKTATPVHDENAIKHAHHTAEVITASLGEGEFPELEEETESAPAEAGTEKVQAETVAENAVELNLSQLNSDPDKETGSSPVGRVEEKMQGDIAAEIAIEIPTQVEEGKEDVPIVEDVTTTASSDETKIVKNSQGEDVCLIDIPAMEEVVERVGLQENSENQEGKGIGQEELVNAGLKEEELLKNNFEVKIDKDLVADQSEINVEEDRKISEEAGGAETNQGKAEEDIVMMSEEEEKIDDEEAKPQTEAVENQTENIVEANMKEEFIQNDDLVYDKIKSEVPAEEIVSDREGKSLVFEEDVRAAASEEITTEIEAKIPEEGNISETSKEAGEGEWVVIDASKVPMASQDSNGNSGAVENGAKHDINSNNMKHLWSGIKSVIDVKKSSNINVTNKLKDSNAKCDRYRDLCDVLRENGWKPSLHVLCFGALGCIKEDVYERLRNIGFGKARVKELAKSLKDKLVRAKLANLDEELMEKGTFRCNATARRDDNTKKLKKLDRKKDRMTQESDDSDILDATSEKSQLTRRSPRAPAKIAYSECDDSEDEADSVVSDQPWMSEADEANRIDDMSEEFQTTRHTLQPPTKKPRKDPINKTKKKATKSSTSKKVASTTARRDDNAKKLKTLDRKKDRMSQESDDSDFLDATSEKSQLTRRSPRVPAKIAYSKCDDSEDEADSIVSDQPWIPEADEANRMDDISEELQTTHHTMQPPTKKPRKEIDPINKQQKKKEATKSSSSKKEASSATARRDNNAKKLKKLDRKKDRMSQESDDSDVLDVTSEKSQLTRRSPRVPAKIAYSKCDDSEDEADSVVSDQPWIPEADEANRMDDMSEELQTTRHTLQPPTKKPRKEIDPINKVGSTKSEWIGESTARRDNNAKKLKKLDRKKDRMSQESDDSDILDATSEKSQLTRRSPRVPAKIAYSECDNSEDAADSVVSDQPWISEADEANGIDDMSEELHTTRHTLQPPTKNPRKEIDPTNKVGSTNSDLPSKHLDEANITDATSKTSQSNRRSTRSTAEIPRREKDSQDEVGSDASAQRTERRTKRVVEANIIDAISKTSQSNRRSTRSTAEIPRREKDSQDEVVSDTPAQRTERRAKEVDKANIIDAISKTSQSNRRSTRSTAELPRREKDSQDEVVSDTSAQRMERRAKEVDEANIIDAISKTSQSNRRNTRSTAEVPRREKDSQDEVGSDTSAQRTERRAKEVDEANTIDATSKISQSTRPNTRSITEEPRREEDSQGKVGSDTSAQRMDRLSEQVDEASIIDATSKTWQSTRRNTRSTAEVPRREKDSQDEVGSDTSAQKTERRSKQIIEANIIDATSKILQSTRRSTRSPAKKPSRPEHEDPHSEADSTSAHRNGERLLKEVDTSNMIETGNERPAKIRMLTTPQKTIPSQDEQDIINQKELPQHQSPSVIISPLRASDVSSSQEQNSRERHVTRGWKNATTKKHESSPAANRVRTSRKEKYSDIFVDILNESSSEEEIDKENDFFEPEEILQQTKRNESKWKSTRVVKSREQPRKKQQPKDVSFEFSSEEEVMDSILEEGNTSSTVQHGGRRKFTKDEEEYIRQGVRRFGVGHWKEILARYPFQNRTSVNLKDKWRNMVKNGQT
eukprot:Seg2173.4 transcript_id=Seg2173.4/GoldUCD/mRNA.D3Y31 product="Telomeric repeat-binding factor 2" protein_id=Seg2173.4/GoldUCD/D3Y31